MYNLSTYVAVQNKKVTNFFIEGRPWLYIATVGHLSFLFLPQLFSADAIACTACTWKIKHMSIDFQNRCKYLFLTAKVSGQFTRKPNNLAANKSKQKILPSMHWSGEMTQIFWPHFCCGLFYACTSLSCCTFIVKYVPLQCTVIENI